MYVNDSAVTVLKSKPKPRFLSKTELKLKPPNFAGELTVLFQILHGLRFGCVKADLPRQLKGATAFNASCSAGLLINANWHSLPACCVVLSFAEGT